MNKRFNLKEIQQALPKGPYSEKANQAENKNRYIDILNREIHLFGTGVPDKIKETFYLELSTLLGAGVDMRSALALIADEQSKKKYKILFDSIYTEVLNGNTLSKTLFKAKGFTVYEYQSIQIGEETGRLHAILNDLAVYFRTKIKQRQQVIGALTYPILVLGIACVAVIFMVMYVVPMFADVFKRFGGDLPFITKAVLHVANIVRKSYFFATIFITAIGFFCFVQRGKDWYRKWTSAATSRIPLIGIITQKIYLSRFCNTMALLIGSKVPITQGIALVKEMISYYPIEATLDIVEADIMAGQSLSDSLRKHAVYPKKMISLLKAGEEVNKLELFFLKITEQYTAEVEYQTSLLSKFIEPLIIVILGFVVGSILIAMYLPLFKFGQSV